MPRERLYDSNADRQAAYRARLAERQALAGSGQLTRRLAELEKALAAANRRADQAEVRAARAERQAAAARDRYADLLATRPNRLPSAPVGPRTRRGPSAGRRARTRRRAGGHRHRTTRPSRRHFHLGR